jgi:STAS domain
MLRITVLEDANEHVIRLEGKIIGPWVEEFARTWRSQEPSRGSKDLRLDLRGVGFVDVNGQRLLHEIYQKTHASFLADSPLTHYFASEAMQQKSYDKNQGA